MTVVVTTVYRSQVAPGIVVEKILKYWQPGYHNIVDDNWLAAARYQPLYRVSEYRLLKISIKKDTANVLVRIKYQTGLRQSREDIYTFVLKKTKAGWKAERYYRGFAQEKQAVTSLQDVLQQSPAVHAE